MYICVCTEEEDEDEEDGFPYRKLEEGWGRRRNYNFVLYSCRQEVADIFLGGEIPKKNCHQPFSAARVVADSGAMSTK